MKYLNLKNDLTGISRLKLTDTIDARDFEIIKMNMPILTYLDLSETYIDSITIYDWTVGNYVHYNVNEIPMGAFNNLRGLRNDSLKTVLLPLTVTTIGAEAFRNCKGLSSIIIPPNVRTIGDMAFSGCSSLTSITIPSTVTYLGTYAFSNCSNLNSIFIKSPTLNNTCPNYLDSFRDINDDKCTLYVPYGSREVYYIDYYWLDFVDIVEMPGFELSVNYLNITSQSNATNNLEIKSDVTWKISSDQTWLWVNPGSGTGDQMLTFTADTNPTSNTRTAKVTVSADGVESQTISVTQEGGPTALADLAENSTQFKCYPNPFTDEISIEIQNPKRTEISVDIYNLAGEGIKNLAIQRKDEKLDLKWNGTSDSGRKIAPGVYICKVNNRSKQLIYQGK